MSANTYMKHVLTPPAFSPDFVIFALRSAGYRQTDIAAQLDRSVATVCSVVNGRARSKRIENRIATAVGLNLHQLWPQWYGPDNKPIKKRKPWRRIGAETVQALSDQLTDRKAA